MPATPDPGTVLAFDYGTRLIGIAVGNTIAATARPLTTIGNGDWMRCDELVAEWQPVGLVVGLPLALDGGEQKMTRAARDFATALQRRYGLPAHLVDERYTSGEAARRFATRRAEGSARRKDAAAIDALAAAVILEAWFAEAGRAPT